MARGDGTTTAQMKNSPRDAVFVWVNHHLDYPRQLARKIGREDLKIVSPAWLAEMRWVGLELSALVLDHAAVMNDEQWRGWHGALMRVRPSPTVTTAHE